jgi:hypothetical protein
METDRLVIVMEGWEADPGCYETGRVQEFPYPMVAEGDLDTGIEWGHPQSGVRFREATSQEVFDYCCEHARNGRKFIWPIFNWVLGRRGGTDALNMGHVLALARLMVLADPDNQRDMPGDTIAELANRKAIDIMLDIMKPS